MNDPRKNFEKLSRDEQIAAIHGLAREGFSDYGISHATALSVEFIRRVLREQEAGGDR